MKKQLFTKAFSRALKWMAILTVLPVKVSGAGNEIVIRVINQLTRVRIDAYLYEHICQNMPKNLLLICVLLRTPISSIASVYEPIRVQIKPGTITIIGETHKKPESVALFKSLVSDVIKDHQCVVVGLEIGSDQQADLDAVLQGKSTVNKIKLWPPLDHVSYCCMLENFAGFKRKGQCIRVITIDSGMNNDVDRDQWMARKIAEQVGDKPVIVLLGTMHTLKSVHWTAPSGRASVAELLSIKGFKINSFPQRWIPDKCKVDKTRVSRFVSVDSSEALTILNESLIALINATPSKSVVDVVDEFLVWECA